MAELLIGTFVRTAGIVRNTDTLTITPSGSMGLILLDANINYATESNQSSSLWLYMNTVNGTNAGYTKTGTSVVKIASLKHDFGSAITDCSLVGSSTTDTITINPGSFNRFSYNIIPLS